MDIQNLIKQLGGGDEDPKAFAEQMQKLTQDGDFNPFALFSGEARFHSLFLAPFTSSIARGREQFMKDATGPLASVVETFKRQGLDAAQAQQAVREMFGAAVGMAVVVMADDQGLDSIPQLFFGNLEDGFVDHAVKLCGEKFPERDRVRDALVEIRGKAKSGASGALLHGGAKQATPRGYWIDLARRLVTGIEEGIAPQAVERQRDLAWWISGALDTLAEGRADGEYAALTARLAIAGNELDRARTWLGRYLDSDDAEDEHACTLVHRLTDAAVAAGDPAAVAQWLAPRVPPLIARWGKVYDLIVPLFKAQAAAQSATDQLDATVQLMLAANRKAVRQDLCREPLWRVTIADPGELLDTAQAAEVLGRSPAFIAKRLEQGTIPTFRKDDQVRIPRRALESWKAVMEKHKLLD